MPEKLTTEFVKNQFEKYGYTVSNNFRYQNNITHYRVLDETYGHYVTLTYKQLQYRIRNGRSEYIPQNAFMDLPISDDEPVKTSFDRWVNHQNDQIKNLPVNEQKMTFDFYKHSLRQLMKKKDFTLNFSEFDNINELHMKQKEEGRSLPRLTFCV